MDEFPSSSSTGVRYRVALVHSFYSATQPSGENSAVLAQVTALRQAGHDVTLIEAHTDNLASSRWYPLRAAATVATGLGHSPLDPLRRTAPDVVHVHNLFPNFGTTWLREWDGPLVATMHNFRPLCASGTLFRDGSVCTRCMDGHRWDSVRHGCYRGSRAATLPLAWAGRRGVHGHAVLDRADRIVMLSTLSRDVYLRAGLAAERMVVVPNYTEALPAVPTASQDNGRWVFVGRVSEGKGVLDLVRHWPSSQRLDVIGAGPALAECRRVAGPTVRFLASLPRAHLQRRLPEWRGLVFPSRCFENFPMVYGEALSAGLPVLAFDGSTVAQLVASQGTGLVLGRSEALADALAVAERRFPALRARCRQIYEANYSQAIWSAQMTEVYRAVVRGRAAAERATGHHGGRRT